MKRVLTALLAGGARDRRCPPARQSSGVLGRVGAPGRLHVRVHGAGAAGSPRVSARPPPGRGAAGRPDLAPPRRRPRHRPPPFMLLAAAPLAFAIVMLAAPTPRAAAGSLGWASFGLPYLVLPVWSLYELHRLHPRLLLVFLVSVWVNDSVAFLVGSRWGRRKLAPLLSPNKTWEGSLGGFLGSAVVGWGGLAWLGAEPRWQRSWASSWCPRSRPSSGTWSSPCSSGRPRSRTRAGWFPATAVCSIGSMQLFLPGRCSTACSRPPVSRPGSRNSCSSNGRAPRRPRRQSCVRRVW